MKHIRILSVGKIKSTYWQQAITDYAKRISRYAQIEQAIIKDANSKLTTLQQISEEGKRISQNLRNTDYIICLDSHGQQFDSVAFSSFLNSLWDKSLKPCFVIGGSYGISDELKDKSNSLISFSKSTFTHELAQVILYEQLYRALSILAGTGYHH